MGDSPTVLRGGLLVDGTGETPRVADVAWGNGRVLHVAPNVRGRADWRELDARGLVVTPGFIDCHAMAAWTYLLPNASTEKVLQGVTTEVAGNCGESQAPIGPHDDRINFEGSLYGVKVTWQSFGELVSRVRTDLRLNVALFAGHNSLLRGWVPRNQWGKQDAHGTDSMVHELRRCLSEGAVGLTCGLAYAPGSLTDACDIEPLVIEVGRAAGILAVHLRNERDGMRLSVAEAIHLAQVGSVRLLINHLKAAERPNWGQVGAALDAIGAARDDGVNVMCSVYPYDAVSTRLVSFLPPTTAQLEPMALRTALREDGVRHACAHHLVHIRNTDFEALRVSTSTDAAIMGMTIADLANRSGRAPAHVALDLLSEDPEAWVVYQCLDTEDVDRVVMSSHSLIGSDSWTRPVNGSMELGSPHPRTFGTFPRFLRRYSLDSQLLPLETAIAKLTSCPADFLGLRDRGRLIPGAHADILAFDPSTFTDRATYKDPRRTATGMVHVVVNGERVVSEGEVLLARHGVGEVLSR